MGGLCSSDIAILEDLKKHLHTSVNDGLGRN